MSDGFARCPCGQHQMQELYLSLGDYTIMRCLECGLGWTHPPPAPIDYAAADFHFCAAGGGIAGRITVDSLPSEWQRSLLIQAALLQKYLPRQAHIHEVGCGQGLFLEILGQSGFQVSGIDPSVSAAAIARSKGLDVETGFFGAKNVPRTPKCIVLSHVLEHLEKPFDALATAAEVVHGGYLLFFQTNYRGLIPRIVGRKWTWIPEQHFWHFTPASLARWLSRYGFVPIETIYTPLVQHHWKTKLLNGIAGLVPPAYDGFITLFGSRSADSQTPISRESPDKR